MNKHTSPEQSQKLVDAGLPVTTADMYSELNTSIDTSFKWHTPRFIPLLEQQAQMDENDKFFVVNKRHIFKDMLPVWSQAAILNMLPKQIKTNNWVYTLIILPKESKWLMVYVNFLAGNLYMTNTEDFLDAAVDMLYILLKDKLV